MLDDAISYNIAKGNYMGGHALKLFDLGWSMWLLGKKYIHDISIYILIKYLSLFIFMFELICIVRGKFMEYTLG